VPDAIFNARLFMGVVMVVLRFITGELPFGLHIACTVVMAFVDAIFNWAGNVDPWFV
jgi:hypothetical protein